MKIYILFILFFPFSISYSQIIQPYKLIVTLENAPRTTLTLHDYTDERNIFIPGQQINKFTWEFYIADSIAMDSEYLELLVTPYDSIRNTSTSIRFINQTANREVKVANIGLEDRMNYIYAKYIGETLYQGEGLSPNLTQIDSVIYGDVIIQDYRIMKKDHTLSDIEVRSNEPYFAWFSSSGENNKSYDEYLLSYIELSKIYPNSKYLLMNLANNLNKFKSREDVKLIYDNLSNKHSHSKWNFRIKNFLQDELINTQLVNVNTNSYECVIEDFTKHNLIIFTASWCVPCIEEIPILRAMYEDLKENIEFTYVSIDKKSNINQFQNLLKKYNIPWRSLYQADDNDIVKNYYFVSGIPHVILVHPSKQFEILDIRKKEDKDKVYNAILKN